MASCPSRPPVSGNVGLVACGIPGHKGHTLAGCRPVLAHGRVSQFLEKQWKGDNGVSFFLKLTFFDFKRSTLF